MKHSSPVAVPAPVVSPPLPAAETARKWRRLIAWARSRMDQAFGIDARSLALFRIGLALSLLADLLRRACDLEAHYTDRGVLPRSVLIENFQFNRATLCLHLLNGTTAGQAVLFLIAFAFAFLLLVGWRTRLAAFASWILLMSLQARNPLVTHGSDDVLRVLLFWSLFLPLGARWSLDSAGYRRRHPDYAPPARFLSVGTACLLLQMGCIYWFACWLKSDPVWRRDGTAVFYTLHLGQFVTPWGRMLWAYPGLLRRLTFATLAVEGVGPCLAFCPVFSGPIRTLVVFGFVGFHAMLGLCLELGLFPWVCAVGWCVFLPAWFWERPARPAVRLVKRLLRLVRDRFEGAQAIGLRLPFVAHLSARCAAVLADRPMPAPFAPPRLPAQMLAGALLAYMLLWNLRTTNFARFEPLLSRRLNWIGDLSGLGQSWNLFAPAPTRQQGWYVIPATLDDGSEIDLLANGAAVRWQPPALMSATYTNDRWRKYLMNLWQSKNSRYRRYYVRWLCRTWNENHPNGKRIASLQIFYMKQDLVWNHPLPAPDKVLLWTYEREPTPAL